MESNLPDKAELAIEREQCLACGGSGIGGIVSREMELDACMPGIEGQEIPCSFCNGDGWF